jgi:hypothetical protein
VSPFSSERKNQEENMTTRFWISKALLLSAILAALAGALFVPPVRAQQFTAWSEPVNLNNVVLNGTACSAVVNSTSPDSNDTHPALSKDGLSLYFASTRAGGFGDYDLWVSHRDSLDACWGQPTNLGPKVNSSTVDFAPNLSPDGHWLYFHSRRSTWLKDGAPTASCGGADLYVSHRMDTSDDLHWEDPINLGCRLNTAAEEAGPTFFDDGNGTLYLYFTRGVAGKQDTFDIYVSICTADLATCNTQGFWGPGTLVGDPGTSQLLNSPFRDTRTAIRRDGLEMIISSGRPGSLASENLWVSTRPAVTLDQQNWAKPEPINCDDKTGCSLWNPQGTLINSDAFDGGPALSWDGTELYFFRVLAANNALTNCTEGDAQEPPDGMPVPIPLCRDLYVSTRKYITSTELSSSANPSVFGQSVTFTATVSSAADSPPTGTVKFSDETTLGTATLASGQATFTTSSLSIGSHSITGKYSEDRISSGSSGSLTQNVEYGICPLFDQTRSVHSGATFPIKLQLCDANGNDLSSSAIVVHATSVSAVSGSSGTPDSPGNANPDNDFRFDATLGSNGGYIFNLSTGGLTPGTYSLQFSAGSDPITHSVNFGVN